MAILTLDEARAAVRDHAPKVFDEPPTRRAWRKRQRSRALPGLPRRSRRPPRRWRIVMIQLHSAARKRRESAAARCS